MKAILIDASARRIRPTEYTTADDLRKLVGGWISLVPVLSYGDTLYCDEDGLMKEQTAFFVIEGYPQPLGGNGVVVGRELTDDEGEFIGTADPTTTIETLQRNVRWFNREQVDSWGKANASEAAVAVTTFGKDGVDSHLVLQHYGQLIASIPRPHRSDYGWTTADGFIVIMDYGKGRKSVTNDIERVIEDLVAAGADVDGPIIYRDSDGIWDGVLTEHGRFKAFLPLRETSPANAMEKWKAVRA